MEEKGPFLLKAIFFAKFQESAWNWIRFVPSYRNYTFIRTAIERFLVMLLFRFFNIFTSSYLECILSGPGVNWELAKVSFPCLNNFIKWADQKIWPGLKFNTHLICPNSRCTYLILKISHTNMQTKAMKSSWAWKVSAWLCFTSFENTHLLLCNQNIPLLLLRGIVNIWFIFHFFQLKAVLITLV